VIGKGEVDKINKIVVIGYCTRSVFERSGKKLVLMSKDESYLCIALKKAIATVRGSVDSRDKNT
jgi:hypothetical protein